MILEARRGLLISQSQVVTSAGVCICSTKSLSSELCEGTFLHRLTSADHIVTLADAIRVLARSVLNETVVLEVRRSHIVKDALKEARKAKFCANKLAKVILRLH